MFNPIHLLPERPRAWAYILVGGLWFALFAFGTIRFLLQREWELAAFTGFIALLMTLTIKSGMRLLREIDAEQRSL